MVKLAALNLFSSDYDRGAFARLPNSGTDKFRAHSAHKRRREFYVMFLSVKEPSQRVPPLKGNPP